jgi:hypothetical protein
MKMKNEKTWDIETTENQEVMTVMERDFFEVEENEHHEYFEWVTKTYLIPTSEGLFFIKELVYKLNLVIQEE